jgi:hypothetical protein
VRRMICRGLRLEVVALLGMAMALPAMAAANSLATQTKLSAATRVQGGRTQATFAVSVKGEDGLPATGAVVIEEDGKPLAGAALSAEGQARVQVSLTAGEHSLRAVYAGDTQHQASTSEFAGVHTEAVVAVPDFQISVAPAAISLTAGQSGSAVVSITPVNASALSAPMFVTLACSGFPDQSSCNFTPENVAIQPAATTATTSSMVMTTQATSLAGIGNQSHPRSNPVAWAILLPGPLGLAGLAAGAGRFRDRAWSHRVRPPLQLLQSRPAS